MRQMAPATRPWWKLTWNEYLDALRARSTRKIMPKTKRKKTVTRVALALALLGLLAAPASAGQLILTWTDNSYDEQGFKVERCQVIAPATSCTAYIQIATVNALPDAGGTKSYLSGGLAVGTTWCYRVRAYNATGNSLYSNEACGTVAALTVPLDPSNLQVQ